MMCQAMRCAVALLLLSLLPSRGEEARAPEAPPKPTGVYFQYAFFYPVPAPIAPVEAASELLSGAFAETFQDVEDLDTAELPKGNHVKLRLLSIEKYPPPSKTYLQQKSAGLDEPTIDLLLETKQGVLVMDFFVVQPDDYAYLTEANRLAYAVAMNTHALIWDEDTRELYAPPFWQQKRLPQEGGSVVLANTSMHLYEQEESGNYRAVTLGMSKLGLPDLAIYQFPRPFMNPMTALLRFLAEEIARPGPLKAKKAWTPDELRRRLQLDDPHEIPGIELIAGPRDEGDPNNAVWTIDFSKYPGEHYHEQQAFLIRRLLRPDDSIMTLWEHRDKLMELSLAARERLAEKKKAVQDGLEPPERLLVKAYLDEEYVWLAVTEWKEEKLRGVLVQPGAGRQAGEVVEIGIDDIFDYVYTDPEGKEEGNETGKFIREMQAGAGGNEEPSVSAPPADGGEAPER